MPVTQRGTRMTRRFTRRVSVDVFRERARLRVCETVDNGVVAIVGAMCCAPLGSRAALDPRDAARGTFAIVFGICGSRLSANANQCASASRPPRQRREPEAVREASASAGFVRSASLGARRLRRERHAMPNASVSDQSMCPSHACTSVPGTARHVASTSDVPSARWIGMPSTLMNSGASRKPPLLPSRPETNPTTPTTATTRNVVTRASRARDRCVRVGAPRRRQRADAGCAAEREHHDVGDDDERAAGYPARQQRADDRRGKADRQSDAHDASVDVARARVRRDSRATSTESSREAVMRSRRSRERR